MKRRWVALSVLMLCGCDRASSATPPDREALGGGVLARVGDLAIDAAMVAAIAADSGKSLEASREAAVVDALFAAAARADDPAEAASAETRGLARAMLHALDREARRAPVDDAELDNWTQARFVDFDRPPGFRVVHAVVLVKASAPAAEQRAARSHAEEIRAAVEPVVRAAASEPPPPRSPEDAFLERADLPQDRIVERFRKAFSELDHGKLDARFESLGVIAADGRYIDRGKSPWDRLLEEFATAASRLTTRGDVSQVVETRLEADGKSLIGYHVIALLERTPETRVDRETRLRALSPEILLSRTATARGELVRRLRGSTDVVIARNAAALLETIETSALSAAASPPTTP